MVYLSSPFSLTLNPPEVGKPGPGDQDLPSFSQGVPEAQKNLLANFKVSDYSP
jgi:hypothetical protein